MYVFEDGYGSDGSPIYKCPNCYVEVVELRSQCLECGQLIEWE